jgi:hypothetical protein
MTLNQKKTACLAAQSTDSSIEELAPVLELNPLLEL